MTPETAPVVRSDALGLLSNGVYVLASCVGETVHAATVTWATQVSSQPQLVLVALRKNSHLAQAVRKAHRFALNVLAEGQEDLAETFLRHLSVEGVQTDLAGHSFRLSDGHCPLLMDCLAWIECRLAAEPDSPGDHALMLGEVFATGIRRPGNPLVLWNTPWSYGA